MDIHEQYLWYKDIINRQNEIKNIKLNSLLITCNNCKKEIKYNGCTSHYNICHNIFDDKKIFFKNLYNIAENEKCICGKYLFSDVTNEEIRTRGNNIFYCSAKCKYKICAYIKKYETCLHKCLICNNEFLGSSKTVSTCSKKCRYLHSSNIITQWHKDNKHTEEYKIRLQKIGKANNFSEYIKKNGAWNKGLFGELYLKHYDKEDGTNSLIEGLKRSTFLYKKTRPEEIIDDLLNDLEFNYKYNIFHQCKQFDFSVFMNNIALIIEVDGDYWHKSKRRISNQLERDIQRNLDKTKDAIIEQYNNSIKKLGKCWFIIRFWENDIIYNTNLIKSYLIKLKENINDREKFKNIIQEIKEYYYTSG